MGCSNRSCAWRAESLDQRQHPEANRFQPPGTQGVQMGADGQLESTRGEDSSEGDRGLGVSRQAYTGGKG
ncbi:hypothetical protein MRB53_038992 [Persea americana]|nr:hypothetical protein MRB53_038992 [Persea americana]